MGSNESIAFTFYSTSAALTPFSPLPLHGGEGRERGRERLRGWL